MLSNHFFNKITISEKKYGNWSNYTVCKSSDENMSCGAGTQKRTRMCADGSVEKCQKSDFEEIAFCNLEHCPKILGIWGDVGSCVAEGDDPMCGPGRQNQSRSCINGTVDKCTHSDRHQAIPCRLADCPKKYGHWVNTTQCESEADDRNCGPGTQLQTRTCTNGTTDICTDQGMIQTVRCNLIACLKVFGNWTSDGICESKGDYKICGKGLRRLSRTCMDGTIDVCKKNETEKYIECNLQACFRNVGNWTNIGNCTGADKRKDCGKGVQMQSRPCVDGKIIKCTAADREREISCSLPDCPKHYGTWINQEKCTALDGSMCGPGKQMQTRICEDGTNLKCNSTDRVRIQTCNLPDCPKLFGFWQDMGVCNAIGVDKNCGPGEKLQARSCRNGTIDICTHSDRQRSINCSLPDCPKKLGDLINIGQCIASDPHKSCDPTGFGTQIQQRNCTDGTTEQCQPSDMKITVSCPLPKCPSKTTKYERIHFILISIIFVFIYLCLLKLFFANFIYL